MTILVVEDEPTIAEMFQTAFERRGHACLLASSIDEAQWTVMAASPDAITLDLNLGGADSLSWLESLAASRPELARRTTVVTGRVLDDSEAARVAACGANVLLKPIRPSALVEAVVGDVWERRLRNEDAQAPTEAPTWDGNERRRIPRHHSDA